MFHTHISLKPLTVQVAPNLTENLQFVTLPVHLLLIHGGARIYVLALIVVTLPELNAARLTRRCRVLIGLMTLCSEQCCFGITYCSVIALDLSKQQSHTKIKGINVMGLEFLMLI